MRRMREKVAIDHPKVVLRRRLKVQGFPKHNKAFRALHSVRPSVIYTVPLSCQKNQVHPAPLKTKDAGPTTHSGFVARVRRALCELKHAIEESKPQLVRGLLANHRAEYVQKLLKAAKIESK